MATLSDITGVRAQPGASELSVLGINVAAHDARASRTYIS